MDSYSLNGVIYMNNFGVVKPKFPVGTLVRIKRTRESINYDDYGETNGAGVFNTDNMLSYQGNVYRVIDVIRRNRDDKSYWIYTIGDHIYYYAESMLSSIERKEVLL